MDHNMMTRLYIGLLPIKSHYKKYIKKYIDATHTIIECNNTIEYLTDNSEAFTRGTLPNPERYIATSNKMVMCLLKETSDITRDVQCVKDGMPDLAKIYLHAGINPIEFTNFLTLPKYEYIRYFIATVVVNNIIANIDKTIAKCCAIQDMCLKRVLGVKDKLQKRIERHEK